MAINYSTAIKNSRLGVVRDAIAGGRLGIYTSSYNTLLAAWTLSNPAASVADGVLTLLGVTLTTTAIAAGVAAIARFTDDGANVDDSNSTCDWAGDTWLTDTSKSWTDNQWAGHYVSIDGGGLILITGNNATTIWFSGNTNTGAKAYQIRHYTLMATGLTVGTSGADIIIDDINLEIGQTVNLTSGTITHA